MSTQPTRPLVLLLAILAGSACHHGVRPETFVPANGPAGARATMRVEGEKGPREGELLAADSIGIIVRTDRLIRVAWDDIGVDAAKTGMLFSKPLIDVVADFLDEHRVPLVVDPVLVASSGAKLLRDDAVETLVGRLFPLATVVTPNLNEAVALVRAEGTRRELAERLHELGAPAVIVTGGHGASAVDHLFDGAGHLEIPVARHDVRATHGAGLVDVGAGEGPVDVFGLRGAA